jgi:hypothetical protein
LARQLQVKLDIAIIPKLAKSGDANPRLHTRRFSKSLEELFQLSWLSREPATRINPGLLLPLLLWPGSASPVGS